MLASNIVFLENLEWFDETGKNLVHRLPQEGSGEIKWGAQLTVRESQAAVFFYKGKAVGAFGPGRHTLKTGNIPVLTKIASIPWAMSSPLRAEVYFVNLKVFTNLKWGTRDPVAYKDTELGLVRLRAYGVFNIQVVQPALFINRLVGTQGIYTTSEIEEYINRVIVSRFNDFMGQTLDTLLNLPAKYDELSQGLNRRLEEDLGHFGIRLTHLYISAITPPPEVQKAIDDRSRMGVFKDMEKLMQMKAAMAMEKSSESSGEGSSGMGTSLGLMLPAMFAQYFNSSKTAGAKTEAAESYVCPDCRNSLSTDAKFCPQCGHQVVVFIQCTRCGKNLAPNSKFCSRCGFEVKSQPQKSLCKSCGAENLSESIYCNDCGEKL
ncbi:MAG: SPFH domain-containing protein [Desulfobacterales bacterium]|jgi:membrane protease subunit (stomatin/prohibitin family)|nr:SPFH domain-containing protein [Desulfobacterales bacterium]